MPCFLVGRAAARAVAAALGVPLIETSHQVGHIVAATLSACIDKSSFSQLFNGEYIALHVSGGTTDILYVEPSPDELVKISRIGGSMDANAGQIIDRIGVSLGFSFPCGSQLDRAALRVSKPPHIGNLPVRGSEFNLSGLQNIAEKMISDGCSVTDVSAYVLEYIAQSLCRAVTGTQKLRGNLPVIFAGGVMSSEYIKHRLAGIGSFSAPELSSDNAVGVAVTGAVLYRRGVRCSGGGE